jgi:hypothetical protein
MSSEKHKRDTVFPGSRQWKRIAREPRPIRDAGEPKPIRDTRNLIPVVPGFPENVNRGNRVKLPLNLPVNPSKVYESGSTGSAATIEESPWNHYKKIFELELGGSVAVVHKIPATDDLFTMRSFSPPNIEQKLYMLHQLKHRNLLASHQVFSFREKFHVISEYTQVSLEEFIVARPDEVELAAIISQVRNFVSYMVLSLICILGFGWHMLPRITRVSTRCNYMSKPSFDAERRH